VWVELLRSGTKAPNPVVSAWKLAPKSCRHAVKRGSGAQDSESKSRGPARFASRASARGPRSSTCRGRGRRCRSAEPRPASAVLATLALSGPTGAGSAGVGWPGLGRWLARTAGSGDPPSTRAEQVVKGTTSRRIARRRGLGPLSCGALLHKKHLILFVLLEKGRTELSVTRGHRFVAPPQPDTSLSVCNTERCNPP